MILTISLSVLATVYILTGLYIASQQRILKWWEFVLLVLLSPVVVIAAFIYGLFEGIKESFSK